MEFFTNLANSLFGTCVDTSRTEAGEIIDTSADSSNRRDFSNLPIRGSNQPSNRPPPTEQQKRRAEAAKAASNRPYNDDDDDNSPTWSGPSGAPFVLGGGDVEPVDDKPRTKIIKRDIIDQIHFDDQKAERRTSQRPSQNPYTSPTGPPDEAVKLLETVIVDQPNEPPLGKKNTLQSFDFE
eukprot:GEMP01047117.1.p1 GENE.GEMP01047117.1~~GEMP01047117.1.p1  ORF type:complete len:181 (+),score=45.55 GEMP01047117.1:87-629(+)